MCPFSVSEQICTDSLIKLTEEIVNTHVTEKVSCPYHCDYTLEEGAGCLRMLRTDNENVYRYGMH